MSDQDAFERILASLHDAMLDNTLWPATSALIDEACGMQGNSLLVGEGPEDDLRVTFSQAYYRGDDRGDWTREYRDIYLPIDERAPRFLNLSDSRLVHIIELYTAEELKTSLTYNEAMPRFSAQESLNVRLDGPAGSHIIWAFADPVTGDGWTAPQLTLLKGLLPHLRQFIRVRQALAHAEVQGTSVTDLLATPRLGVIHLDRWGRILVANDHARALLRRGDGMTDQKGELRAREPADQARLERLIAAALPAAGVAASGSMLVHRSLLWPPFVVHVKPVGSRQPDYGAQRVAALVLISEPGQHPSIAPHLVAETLGLTPAESRIAVWLAKGRTVQEIATATGRTTETIRWHLKQIYHKRQLSGQADLVRLVLSLAEFVRP